jgi:hypothetical protein
VPLFLWLKYPKYPIWLLPAKQWGLHMGEKPKMTLKVGLAILASIAAIVVVLIGVAFVLKKWQLGNELALPVLAITGIIILLATLALVSIVFALFGLDEPKQALGLPDGSIRAVIALALIVLFGIFSVYFYSTLTNSGSTTGTTFDNLSPATAKTIEATLQPGQLITDDTKDEGTSKERHRLFIRTVPDQASVDFAKQLMTIMGTLVTAIASFYFGSTTTASANSAGARGAGGTSGNSGNQPGGGGTAPSLTAVSPQTIAAGAGPTTLTLTGANLAGINAVSLKRHGANDVVTTNVAATDAQITCTAAIAAGTAPGTWSIVVSGNGVTAQLADKLQQT